MEIEYDRIKELQGLCGENQVTSCFYYLVLFESDKRQLELRIREAEQLLTNGEMPVHRLNDKELAVFLKYSNQIDFDERDIESIKPQDYVKWAMPETVDIKVRRVEVNHIVTHNFRVVNYPSVADDAWLATGMSYPGTKVVLKCRPMDRTKAIRSIDHSLVELRGQWSATGVDSKRMEIENHITTLLELLATLQSDSETLLECSIYVTAYPSELQRLNNQESTGNSIIVSFNRCTTICPCATRRFSAAPTRSRGEKEREHRMTEAKREIRQALLGRPRTDRMDLPSPCAARFHQAASEGAARYCRARSPGCG